MLSGWALWLVVIAALFGGAAFIARKDPAKMRSFGKSITTYISSNRFVIEVLAPAALVVAAALWVGFAAHRTARELGLEGVRLGGVAEAAERWRTGFVPATAGETDEWGRTKSEIARLGVSPAEKLMLMQEVASAAERSGLQGVRVTVTGPESVAGDTRVVAGTTLAAADYGLAVSGEGEFREAARAIALFPGSVQVKTVTLADMGDRMKVSYLLTVFASPGSVDGQ